MLPRLIASLSAVGVALLFAGAAPAAGDLATRANSAAGVTVKATPRALTGGVWEFDIAFDTHSQDLKDDLAKSAVLVAGGRTFTPTVWQGDPPGGHHRKGVLKFNAVDPRPAAIELRITRAGEPDPRTFRWQLE